MVMEKLLEKLRCRTISVPNGSEAVRYAMSDIQFDIIFLEYKLPQINGADVARMVRETKNKNSHTPIVAITAYLKELLAPHYFDSLIEKPISSSKLTEVLRNLCQWKPESPSPNTSMSIPNPIPSSLRHTSSRIGDSPTSLSSVFAGRPGSSLITSSREDSISSSVFGDSESAADDIPVVISRKATGDWDESGLGLREDEILLSAIDSPKSPPQIIAHSAPAQLDMAKMPMPKRSLEKLKAKRESIEKRLQEGTDSADDEDDELGLQSRDNKHRWSKPALPSSKLGIEMMRANSHDSVTVTSDSTTEPVTQVVTPTNELELPPLDIPEQQSQVQTPPDAGSPTGDKDSRSVEATPRPHPATQASSEDEPTPRPSSKVSQKEI
jgi:serine/threonine-protein kinase RIM15